MNLIFTTTLGVAWLAEARGKILRLQSIATDGRVDTGYIQRTPKYLDSKTPTENQAAELGMDCQVHFISQQIGSHGTAVPLAFLANHVVVRLALTPGPDDTRFSLANITSGVSLVSGPFLRPPVFMTTLYCRLGYSVFNF